jgi:hypothetical protein
MTGSQRLRENARDCEAMAAKADRAADKMRYQRMAAAWKRLASVDAWLERHKEEIMGDAGSAGSPHWQQDRSH